jgi:hypothetical protein
MDRNLARIGSVFARLCAEYMDALNPRFVKRHEPTPGRVMIFQERPEGTVTKEEKEYHDLSQLPSM